MLYLFPGTALANDHKLGNLKQFKCILSKLGDQMFEIHVSRIGSFLRTMSDHLFQSSLLLLVFADNLCCSLACRYGAVIAASVVT